MQSGVYGFFGVNYYTHCSGFIFVFPFVVWLFFAVVLFLSQLAENIFEKAGKPLKWRSVILPAVMIPISFVVAFWDVYFIGQQATKLCKEQAGLHVYKTVEADGVSGIYNIKYWSEYGFKFIENIDIGNKIRYTYVGGKSKVELVDKFNSKYAIVNNNIKISNRIFVVKYLSINIETNEILGDLAYVVVYGGWADMLFYNLTGFTYSPWSCGRGKNIESNSELTDFDLVKATIKPVILK